MASSLFPGIDWCPIRAVTGIPCPACGMSRAFFSLPNLSRAFFYHPLFWVVPLVPLLALFSERVKNVLAVIVAALFLGTWVVRMVLFFPHTEPMTYNQNSLVEFILAALS